MNSYLLRNLSGITSASIEKYLLFTGWVRDDTFNSTRMWVFKSKSDPEFKIAVPASEKATDFYPQVYNLIQTLSVVDGKTEQEIIDSLKSAYTDRLQFRIITEESQGGKLPLDYAARCLEGLKDLVLYAACAEENAKPICARTYNSAKRALEKFQFGQTQIGSFIINIDVQVADEENEQLYLIDAGAPPDEPPEHKIVLLQTLQLVRVQAAIAVGMDGRLIEIVCTAPLERHKLLDGFKVNVEHIAAQRHFSDIGAHVADARLGHALPNDLQLVRPYPHIDGDAADALFRQRSSRSRLRRLGGCSRTLSSGLSSGGGTGRLLMMPSI